MKRPEFDISSPGSAISTVWNYLEYFRKGFIDYKSYTGDGALTDVAKMTRVEPLTIVSKDLLSVDYTKDVADSLLSLFSAYYLQAVNILTVVQSVRVKKILQRLNPNVDSSTFLSLESHPSHSLEHCKFQLPKQGSLGLEAFDENKKPLIEASSLSIGKLLDVEIKTSFDKTNKKGEVTETIDESVTVPMSIRLLTSVVSNEVITNLLAGKMEDKSIVERYHAWRAGRISFIKDLILCQDLIDEHKKMVIKDESGIVEKIMSRVLNTKTFGVMSKSPSLMVSSNLFIISEAVAKEVEQKVGGKFSNTRIKNKIFEDTYAMIIAVVDREWERVTFYVRGVDDSTDLSIKEIKTSSKNGGPDITDILKSFQLGSGANF